MFLDPARIMAGETTAWKLSLAAFPASEWTLKLAAANATASLAATAQADGDNHTIELSAVVTGAYSPGSYRYNLTAEKGEGAAIERHVVEVGDLVVVALVDGLEAVDTRSGWQRILDDLMAAYKDFVSTGALRASYSVGDRSASFTSHADILAAIERARREVNLEAVKERARKGLRGAPKIFTRYPI